MPPRFTFMPPDSVQATLAGGLFVLLFITLATLFRSRGAKRDKSIAIIVLGDIGRSPRMMRHAISFADSQWRVSVFAYAGSSPPKAMTQHANIEICNLPEFPEFVLAKLPRLLFALAGGPLKALYLSVGLLWVLILKARGCSYMMVQNPPAIPTLPIVQLARLILGSKLVIDWHNTAFSILALKFDSDRHPMVHLAKWIESKCGKRAHLHLFVTEAERSCLSRSWSLEGKKTVFYDRPPRSFSRLTVPEIHSFFSRCSFNSDLSLTSVFNTGLPNETLLTCEDPETLAAKPKPNRPALLVSSTSWTADEDFSLLIDALSVYTASRRTNAGLPALLCLITGKGPLKAYYGTTIAQRAKEEGWEASGVKCAQVWLEDADDYARLLGSADVGVSLHQSSSGLDLPMKVVDMFGCGLPVCARKFSCISELVQDGQNGLVFESASQLASQLQNLLDGFSACRATNAVDGLRKGIVSCKYGVEEREWSDWETEWKRDVLGNLMAS